MKTKLIIILTLLNWSLMASADEAGSDTKAEEIEVTVNKEGGKLIKKVIVNGKELSEDEIAEMEASGKLKTIHMDHNGLSKSGHKVMMFKSGDSDHADMEKHIKIIKQLDGELDEDVQVFINKEGDKTTEKIIVNGKELSEDEIAEFKASGKMKVINIDSDMVKGNGHKMMFINSDAEHGEDIDLEVIMEKIDGLHEIDESTVQEWISEDGKNIKIMKKGFFSTEDDDSASLGFMANVEDDGWHLTKIIDKSGAKDAGILIGDVVTSIGGVDLTKSQGSDHLDLKKLPKFEDGDVVKVNLNRDGSPITFDVQARKLDKSELIIDLKTNIDGDFNWVEEFHENGDIASNIKVMVFDGENGNFKFNEDDINMVFPEKLGKMNFFISDGKSTSKLLGKNHEMSSMSEGLSKYFNTNGGVLVLHVDDANVFNLKDGDVIKSINDNEVDTPKDVIKHLIKADDQENIKMKVVRNKKNKTLKYKK